MVDRIEPASGLAPAAKQALVRDFFAAFRWEPPRIDPHVLTARAYFEQLERPR